jgi:hypothetical protein
MTKKEHLKLLNQVFDCLQEMTQWVPNSMYLANECIIRASALLDILEEDIFGVRRNAFKKGHVPKYKPCGVKLYDRFYYIVKEFKCEKQIKKICYFDVESMYEYYKQLSELRESFNR